VTRGSTVLSGALIGFVEASSRSTPEKNALCPPTMQPNTPFDWLRLVLDGMRAEAGWKDAPDVRQWIDHSRLSLRTGIDTSVNSGEFADIQRRVAAAYGPAMVALDAFAAQAT
jgi:hypothetical protein